MARYQSPTGAEIVGTSDQLLATDITGIDPETGEPEYEGSTEIHWDTQVTLTRDRKRLFIDDSGEEWTFDELEMIDEEDEDNE